MMTRLALFTLAALVAAAPAALAQSWSALGSGTNSSVTSVTLGQNGVLYVGGGFTQAGGQPASNIAAWDGTAWSPLGAGVDNSVSDIAVGLDGTVYAAGFFTQAGGQPASRVAAWDGTAWSALGAGLNSPVNALAVGPDGTLYAAGNFSQAGGQPASRIAAWDGTAWSPLGTGLNGNATEVAVGPDGTVYVGGGFSQAGGQPANRVAAWDGTAWSPLGTGADNIVDAFAFGDDGELYAAGFFTTIGGQTANAVAVWDGTAWSALGTGLGTSSGGPSGRTLALDADGTLYVGGFFDLAGGQPAANIAAWDGTAWSALGDGTSGLTLGLAYSGTGDLFVGGFFTNAGGQPALRVAAWDGAAPITTYLYWANNNDNTIGRSNIDGTGVDQDFIATGAAPRGITQDDQYVYWANTGSNSIGRSNIDGTGVDNSFLAPGGTVYGIAVSKQFIYWSIAASGGTPGSIGRANLDGTGATTIVSNVGAAGIAIDDQYLYWAEIGVGPTAGRIGRANIDGSSPNPAFITGARRPFGVAVDDAHVFWSNENAPGIGRANLDGTGVDQDFVSFPAPPPNSFPRGIAITEEYIFWPDFGRDTIGRADLDGTNVRYGFVTGANGPFAVGTASAVATAPDLTATLTGDSGYRVLAHPTGGTVDDLLGDLWTEGFPGSDNDASAFCSVLTWTESAWTETVDGVATAFGCVASAATAIPQGRGVFAYVFGDDDRTTPAVDGGFPKTLTVIPPAASTPFSSFGITYTENPQAPAARQGWNLLGNPLGAGFDWDLTTRSNPLGRTVYVYDPGYLGGNYRTWTADVGGDLTDGVVPAFQGFFAKANAAGATLEIPTAAVVDPSPALYGKGSATADPLRFELALAGEPVSVGFVAATDGAALGLDAFDAYRLTPTAWPRTVLSTTVLDADGEPVALALNALPADAVGEITVPVEVSAAGHAPGTALALELSWTGGLPDGWTAALRDAATGEETALVAGGRYAFALDVPTAREGAGSSSKVGAAGLGLALLPGATGADALASTDPVTTGDRLSLVLRAAGATSTGSGPELAFGLAAPAPNPAAGLVRVGYALSADGPARVAAYDALGREVAVLADGAHAAGAHEAVLDGRALAPGVYVVRLTTAEAASVRRVTIAR